jgi:hypothetical protein
MHGAAGTSSSVMVVVIEKQVLALLKLLFDVLAVIAL